MIHMPADDSHEISCLIFPRNQIFCTIIVQLYGALKVKFSIWLNASENTKYTNTLQAEFGNPTAGQGLRNLSLADKYRHTQLIKLRVLSYSLTCSRIYMSCHR